MRLQSDDTFEQAMAAGLASFSSASDPQDEGLGSFLDYVDGDERRGFALGGPASYTPAPSDYQHGTQREFDYGFNDPRSTFPGGVVPGGGYGYGGGSGAIAPPTGGGGSSGYDIAASALALGIPAFKLANTATSMFRDDGKSLVDLGIEGIKGTDTYKSIFGDTSSLGIGGAADGSGLSVEALKMAEAHPSMQGLPSLGPDPAAYGLPPSTPAGYPAPGGGGGSSMYGDFGTSASAAPLAGAKGTMGYSGMGAGAAVPGAGPGTASGMISTLPTGATAGLTAAQSAAGLTAAEAAAGVGTLSPGVASAITTMGPAAAAAMLAYIGYRGAHMHDNDPREVKAQQSQWRGETLGGMRNNIVAGEPVGTRMGDRDMYRNMVQDLVSGGYSSQYGLNMEELGNGVPNRAMVKALNQGTQPHDDVLKWLAENSYVENLKPEVQTKIRDMGLSEQASPDFAKAIQAKYQAQLAAPEIAGNFQVQDVARAASKGVELKMSAPDENGNRYPVMDFGHETGI